MRRIYSFGPINNAIPKLYNEDVQHHIHTFLSKRDLCIFACASSETYHSIYQGYTAFQAVVDSYRKNINNWIANEALFDINLFRRKTLDRHIERYETALIDENKSIEKKVGVLFTGKVRPLENKVAEIRGFIKAVLDGKEVTWPDDEPKSVGNVPESTRMRDLIIIKAREINAAREAEAKADDASSDHVGGSAPNVL